VCRQPTLSHLFVPALILLASACAHVPPDKALVDVDNGNIYWIDRMRLPHPGSGPFAITPGGHTLQVNAEASEQLLWVVTFYKSGLRTLCLKARGGHRYRVKATAKNGEVDVFIVDRETGKPPITPCGPDEDED
jgi:hypothetical protein